MVNPSTMQPGERLAHALQAPQPYQLFRKLPPEDLLLMILDAEPHDVELAIKYANEEQHRDIVDLYVWEKDEIREDLVMGWLMRLMECGERKLIQVIKKLDPELLLYTFKQYIHVVTHEDPDDPLPDCGQAVSGPKSVDSVFFYFHLKKDFEELIDTMLIYIFNLNQPAYKTLMYGCQHELSMQLMEDAFHWRSNRMEERGFENYIDSKTIFKELDEEEIEELKHAIPEEPKTIDPPGEVKLVSHSYFCGLPDASFLKKTFQRLELQENGSDLKWEATLTMNKLISASLASLSDIKKIKNCVKGGADVLSLALDYLADGSPERGVELLEEIKLETLFQVGYSLVRHSCKRLKRFLGNAHILDENTLFLLGSPRSDILKGVLKTPALFFHEQLSGYGNFEKKEHLALAEKTIGEAECLDELFNARFKLQVEGIHKLKNYKLSCPDITFSSLFITGICNIILKRHFEFEPVPAVQLTTIREKAFHIVGDVLELRCELAEEFSKWMDELTADLQRGGQNMAKELLSEWFQKFFQEFGSIDPSSDIEPGYVETVLVSVG